MPPEASPELRVDPFASDQPPTERIKRTIEQLTREALRDIIESWYQGLESDLSLQDDLATYCNRHNIDSLNIAQIMNADLDGQGVANEHGLALELQSVQTPGTSPQNPSQKKTEAHWRILVGQAWMNPAEAMKNNHISLTQFERLQRMFLDHQGYTLGFKLKRGAVSVEINDLKHNEHGERNQKGEIWFQIKDKTYVHALNGQIYEIHGTGRELLENFEIPRPKALKQLRLESTGEEIPQTSIKSPDASSNPSLQEVKVPTPEEITVPNSPEDQQFLTTVQAILASIDKLPEQTDKQRLTEQLIAAVEGQEKVAKAAYLAGYQAAIDAMQQNQPYRLPD